MFRYVYYSIVVKIVRNWKRPPCHVIRRGMYAWYIHTVDNSEVGGKE